MKIPVVFTNVLSSTIFSEVKKEVEELEKNTEVEDVKTNDGTEIKKAGNAGITFTPGATGADVNELKVTTYIIDKVLRGIKD